jgi:hypothetical protein
MGIPKVSSEFHRNPVLSTGFKTLLGISPATPALHNHYLYTNELQISQDKHWL